MIYNFVRGLVRMAILVFKRIFVNYSEVEKYR